MVKGSPATEFYRAYGLSCSADSNGLGFQGEAEASGLPDLVISSTAEPPDWVRAARNLQSSSTELDPKQVWNPGCRIRVLGRRQYFELSYVAGAEFVVDGEARRVWGWCSPPLTFADLGVYLRGPVMGFILRQRGIIALHASALCIEGHALVLCGPSEAGKSTTAAALALRGAPALCDDIAALTNHSGRFYVEPGYPRICLWPDAVQDLCGVPDALPHLTPDWEKCFLPLDGDGAKFESQPRALGAIYFFGARVSRADAPRIEELNSREGLLELVQNTYMNWVLDKKQRAAEFDVLAHIAAQTPMRRIFSHIDAAHLGQLCDLIVRDARQLITDRQSAEVVAGH